MRAFQLTQWQHDGEFVEVDQPEPGPGQVVVRVGGAGACHSDLHLMHDFVDGMLPWGPPFTLGHENAGWVESLGAGVDGLAVGDPVAVYGPWGCGRCARCLVGAENYCERAASLGAAGGGLGRDGGMAPYMLVPNSRWLVPLGDLDPVDAAPLTDAGLTPYHAIKRSLAILTPGSCAVVIGAGGLGHMAIQILRQLTPATVVVIDSSAGAREMALSIGADHALLPDEAAGAIPDLTSGRGVDLCLDFVGSDDSLVLGASVTRSLGHLSIVGLGGGTLPLGFFSIAYEVSVATTYWGSLPELLEVLTMAQAGQLTPVVQRFPLAETPTAYEALRAGSLHGRAVIVP